MSRRFGHLIAVRRLCALVALAIVLAVPPQVLAATCNVPPQVASILAGSSGPGVCAPSSLLGALVGLIAGFVWLYLVLAAVLRAVAVVAARARPDRASRLLAVSDRVVGAGWLRRLVDVVVGLGLVAVSATNTMSTDEAKASPLESTAVMEHAVSLVEQLGALLGVPQSATDGRPRLYRVRPGDTLARIARKELGDPELWPWIFELNRGRVMPDGTRLDRPSDIRPGWVLTLPPRELVRAARNGEPLSPPHSTPATSRPLDAPPSTRGPQPAVKVELPSGSVVAASLALGMASALLLGLLRERRRRRPGPPEPGICRYQPETAEVAERLASQVMQAQQPDERPAAIATELEPSEASLPAGPLPTMPLSDLTCVDPGRVPMGERDGFPVELDLATLGALVIEGTDAVRVARAAMLTLLAQRGPASAEVLVVGDLLPGVAEFPGLRRVDELTAALAMIEAELAHRRRLLENEEIDDFTSHRQHYPDDPLPALVLLAAGIPVREAGRLEVLAAQGAELGVGLVLIDAEIERAARIELDDTARVTRASPTTLDVTLAGARLFSLSAIEAADLLATLARARMDLPVRPLPPAEPFAAPTASPAPLVRVRLLGTLRVETASGQEIRRGMRRKALELLVYYLLNPDGATQEQAVEALWPSVALGREAQWFWNALGNLRSILRRATGDEELAAISREGDPYRADPELFEVDLWRFESHLAEAKRAASERNDGAEARALAGAAEAYGGELVQGAPYSWVTIPREDLRRRAVNALVRLAELQEADGDAQGALAALEQGITVDPVAEELYRRVMGLQARLGRPDAVRRTYQALERQLADLDVDPEPATEALAAELLQPRRSP